MKRVLVGLTQRAVYLKPSASMQICDRDSGSYIMTAIHNGAIVNDNPHKHAQQTPPSPHYTLPLGNVPVPNSLLYYYPFIPALKTY